MREVASCAAGTCFFGFASVSPAVPFPLFKYENESRVGFEKKRFQKFHDDSYRCQRKKMVVLDVNPFFYSRKKPCSHSTHQVNRNVQSAVLGADFLSNWWNSASYRPSSLSAPLDSLLCPMKPIKGMREVTALSSADSNKISTDSLGKESENTQELSDSQLSAGKPNPTFPLTGNIEVNVRVNNGSSTQIKEDKTVDVRNDAKEDQEPSSLPVPPKRSPLTAREKLRAARVLSKYTESKPSKRELSSSVLDAIKESERGKARGLPQAPTNMFDDSKRGLPKPGWTFDLPGGVDLLFIVFSFVFISTVMFATTYIVWKLGAIHFNEY